MVSVQKSIEVGFYKSVLDPIEILKDLEKDLGVLPPSFHKALSLIIILFHYITLPFVDITFSSSFYGQPRTCDGSIPSSRLYL